MVVVSGGRLVEGADEYDRLRLGVMLRALGAMDCAAFAPSSRELTLRPRLRRSRRRHDGRGRCSVRVGDPES